MGGPRFQSIRLNSGSEEARRTDRLTCSVVALSATDGVNLTDRQVTDYSRNAITPDRFATPTRRWLSVFCAAASSAQVHVSHARTRRGPDRDRRHERVG